MKVLHWTDFASRDEAYHIARYFYRRPEKRIPHSHSYAELFWFESGSGWHEVNGRRRRHSKGDLIFVRPDDRHTLWCSDGEAFAIVNLQFMTANVARLSRAYGDKVSRYWPKGGPPVELHLDDDQLRELKDMTHALAGSERTRIVLDRFILNFLHLAEPGGAADASDPAPSWLSAACREIRDPAKFYLGTGEFVRLCNRCPEHVARSAQRYLGKSPSEIVNAARMDYAASQLLMSDTDILEISLTCGYESLSYFYRLFRNRFGMSPRKYRTVAMLKETQL